MSNREQISRSPMASRRIRRHAMGVSNAHSVDEASSSISRSTVSLIHADRLVKVPQHLRPAERAARETLTEDRPMVNRVHDKLFKTHRERFVRQVLRSCSPDSSGLLSANQLRSALDSLHVGLEPEERDRIIARAVPEEGGKVHYLDFMRTFEIPQPLGDEQVAQARKMSIPGPPIVRPGGGGSGVGDGGASYWNWQRHGPARPPGLLDEVREGTWEQLRSDELLTGLLASKLGNCRDKLRAVFRQMDSDRNSLIDREEFARGVAKLRINVSREQLDRLFDQADVDRDGFLDYTEFAERFEEPGLTTAKRRNAPAAAEPPDRSRPGGVAAVGPEAGVPLTQSLGLSPDEVQGAMRHPLVLELARSLYGKGGLATAPFKHLDLPRSGRLDVRDMTAACRALVPGIGERQVAAVMAAVEPDCSGRVDYRAFVERLTEGGNTHPRLAHSAPPGGKGAGKGEGSASGSAAGGGGGALSRFGETLTVPEALPTPHTRALSAVSLSRRNDEVTIELNSASGGASQIAAPPPPPSTTEDRESLYTLHAIAIAPFLESLNRAAAAAAASTSAASGGGGGGGSLPAVTQSVDIGVLSRSQSGVRQDLMVTTTGTVSRAPSHATGRFSRFWTKRYADTTSVTTGDPASALCTGPEGTFVRKGANDDFLQYQLADRAKEARRREQLVQRYAARSEVDSRYSAADDASGADDGRLAVARAARRRYEERCEMYDRLRHEQDKSEHAFFGRLPVFGEHKSDTANMPVREDQTRSYW